MKINTYYRKTGQDDRNIDVLIFYKNEGLDGQIHSRTPNINVIVRNDSTTGISSEEIDTGGDKLYIPGRRGRATRWMRIAKILNQNPGFMRLELK